MNDTEACVAMQWVAWSVLVATLVVCVIPLFTGELIAADPKVLAAWLARFEELAEETRRSDPAGAERRFPATRAAVRAALAGADRELADGRPQAARIWLERVTVHLALRAAAGETGTFDATAANAVSARLAAIEGLPGPTAPAVTQTLTGPLDALDTLPAPRTLAFEFQRKDEDPYLADLLGRQDRGGLERGPGLSIRPGLAALTACWSRPALGCTSWT